MAQDEGAVGMPDEGVIRFSYELIERHGLPSRWLGELQRWRRELFSRDSIGGDLTRYGASYGNVSVRIDDAPTTPGHRAFLVSCTQTGGLIEPGPECYCVVRRYSHIRNHVVAEGTCPPSSESLTHAAMYDASDHIRAIVHGHDPNLWRWLQQRGAPATPQDVDYGTVAMAAAASRTIALASVRPWSFPGILSMNGHLDGVIAWGTTPEQATTRYLNAWNASRE